MRDALVRRPGLGQEDRADADAERFQQIWGGKLSARAAQVVLALAAYRVEHGEWKQAEKALSAPIIEKAGTLDVRVQAETLLGRTFAASKKDADADKSYGAARDAWRDPQAAVKQLEGLGEGDATRRIGRVLTAVGEARFYFAEQKRAAAESLRAPAFTGRSEPKELVAFTRGPLGEWYQKRRLATLDAERSYVQILELQPAPPPAWVVASSAAVGAMWARLTDELRAAPYPKNWDKDGDVPGIQPPLAWHALRDAYRTALDALLESGPRLQAKAAYKTCVDWALKFQWLDDTARGCRVWLAQNYPAEGWQSDEILAPVHATSMVAARAEPVAWDGETILDGRPEALVMLAALGGGGDGEGLRGALALDDGYVPAFAQLARFVLASAEENPAERALRLMVAELMCSQAIRKQPNDALLHETLGLVELGRGERGRAAQSFALARRLDPRALAPRLDFAALMLPFGGFEQAEAAYREALALDARSFDAHLGLALALAGKGGETPTGAVLDEIHRELGSARDIDGARYRTAIEHASERARAADAGLPH